VGRDLLPCQRELQLYSTSMAPPAHIPLFLWSWLRVGDSAGRFWVGLILLFSERYTQYVRSGRSAWDPVGGYG
jgi:hypothetical protein